MSFFRFRFLLRQKRFLVFTVIVVLLFLMYQLFFVGQLGKEFSKRHPRSRMQKNFRNYEKADGFMQSRSVDKEPKEDVWQGQAEVRDNQKFVLGVLPTSQKYYKPSARNTFKCLHTGEEIKYSFVNDNFCDCPDLSDEPSTSACNTGRFFCTHQSKHHINSILSYKVNDGICDCCDGSDEWLHITLPEHTLVPVKKQKGIFQVPCPVRCIS